MQEQNISQSEKDKDQQQTTGPNSNAPPALSSSQEQNADQNAHPQSEDDDENLLDALENVLSSNNNDASANVEMQNNDDISHSQNNNEQLQDLQINENDLLSQPAEQNQSDAQSVVNPESQNELGNESKELQLIRNICVSVKEVAVQVDMDKVLTKLCTKLGQNLDIIKEQLLQMEKEKRDQYIQETLVEINETILNENLIFNEQHLICVFEFLRIMISEFFPLFVDCEPLCATIDNSFDQKRNLYSIALASNRVTEVLNKLNQNSNTMQVLRVQNEMEWRDQLKEGDAIDAIKIEKIMVQGNTTSNRISSWSPAIIDQISEDRKQVIVVYKDDYNMNKAKLSMIDWQIAKPGTFTQNWDFRDSLQVGDNIDCVDEHGIWYRSTLFEIKETEIEGQVAKEVLVGFRHFEEKGQKVDGQGRNYTGWSEKFDEWKLLSSPCIQPFLSMSQAYKNVGKNQTNFDIVVADTEDVIESNKDIVQIAVPRSQNYALTNLLSDFLNKFSQQQGFENILKLFNDISQSNKQKISFTHVMSLTGFIQKIQLLITRQFVCNYVPRFIDAYSNAMKSQYSPIQIQPKVDHVSRQSFILQQTMRRYHLPETYSSISDLLNVHMGSILLRHEVLEKRLFGIKMVSDFIKATRYYNRTVSQAEMLIEIKKLDLFNEVFAPDKYHSQIVNRATELLRIYARENALEQAEADLLWQTMSKDEHIKIEIYSMISEIAQELKDDSIDLFVLKFQELEPRKMQERDVDQICALARDSITQSKTRQYACEILWAIAVQDKPYPKTIIKQARLKLTDLIKHQDRSTKEKYVNQCIENIKNHKSVIQSIKIMTKILNMLPKYQVWNLQVKSLKEFVQELIDNQDIVGYLIKDLETYQSLVEENWQNGLITPKNLDTQELFEEGFTHKKNVQCRLKAIWLFLDTSETRGLSGEQLQNVWDILMVKSTITSDRELFFDWLQKILQLQDRIKSELIVQIFNEKVVENPMIVHGIKMNGYECIQSLFLQANEYENNINLITRPGETETQYQSQVGTVTTKKKLQFRVHIAPHKLQGMDVIWQMFQYSDQSDANLRVHIIAFISQIYASLSRLVSDEEKIEIRDHFAEQCFQRMQAFISNDQILPIHKTQFVKNTQLMMQSFLQDCEQNGLAGLRQHASLNKSLDYFEKVIVYNLVSNNSIVGKPAPKYFVFSVNSTMTVYEMIDLIAKQINMSPLKIHLVRDSSKPEIRPNHNCMSLKDLKFTSGEELRLLRVSKNLKRVPLLNPQTNELVKEAASIFASWFDAFSVEVENEDIEAGNTKEKVMTKETCAQWLEYAQKQEQNFSNKVSPDDSRIRRLFNEYDIDSDERLTLTDFLRFYRDQSIQKTETVWTNLKGNNVGEDLQPRQPLDIAYKADVYLNTDFTHLPRYKISQNEAQFLQLFDLTKYLDQQGQDTVWKLIQQLKTNPQMFMKLLKFENEKVLMECTLQDGNSIFKLLYSLQIVNWLLNSYSVSKPDQVVLYYEKQYGFADASEDAENAKGSKENKSNEKQYYPSLEKEDKAANQLKQQMEVDKLAGDHWQGVNGGNNQQDAAQVAQDGQTIALPSAEQVNQEQKENQDDEKMGYFAKQLAKNFKGTSVVQIIEQNNLISQEISQQEFELLKQNWLPKFIENKGFESLIAVLQEFAVSYGQQATLNFKDNYAEQETLELTISMIKTILVACFCTEANNKELQIQLQRKLSDVAENTQDDQNNDKNQDPEKLKTSEEFKPLIDQLSTGLADKIIQSINFEQFQELLLKIFEIILSKGDNMNTKDRAIIKEGLNIWNSLITYNSDLLLKIYQDQSGKYVQILVDQGLMSNDLDTKNSFKQALSFICANVKLDGLPETPSSFFLRALVKKMEILGQVEPRDTQQYFELFSQLLLSYFQQETKAQPMLFKRVIEPQSLIVDIVKRLQNYQSRETKRSQVADNTLVGLLTLINHLITHNSDILPSNEYDWLMNMIVKEYLFTFDYGPQNQHYTQHADIDRVELTKLNKCHTEESRTAAYKLLTTICSQDSNLVEKLVTNYWSQIIQSIPKPNSNNYNPNQNSRSSHDSSGLKNLGAICYMNSMIQQFFNVRPFRYSLMATGVLPNKDDFKEFDGCMVNDNSLQQWMQMFSYLQLTDRQSYNPKDFCFAFKDHGGNPTNVRVQQDAQEFLNVGFERLETHLKDTAQKYITQSVFQGQTCSLTICNNCGNIVETDEDFYCLQMTVKNKKSLSESMEAMVEGETISDYRCSSCDQKVEIEKKVAVRSMPNMLIVHLNRIIFDFEKMRNVKVNDRWEFPDMINIKDYMVDQVLTKQKEKIKEMQAKKEAEQKNQAQNNSENNGLQDRDQSENAKDQDEGEPVEDKNYQQNYDQSEQIVENKDEDMNGMMDQQNILKQQSSTVTVQQTIEDEDYSYKLVGVVIHMGGAEAGHYLSYVNKDCGNEFSSEQVWQRTKDQNWLEFNDNIISSFAYKSKVQEKCFGGTYKSNTYDDNILSGETQFDKTHNAYMLVYEKQRKQPLRVVITPQLQEYFDQNKEALGCDSTTIARGQQEANNNNVSNLFAVYPTLFSQMAENRDIYFDETKKERIANVPFESVATFVPHHLYSQVHNDNQIFLRERQVLCNNFFECTADVLQMFINLLQGQNQLMQDQIMPIYKMVDKLIFEMLIYTGENKHLKIITNFLIQLVEKDDQILMDLISNRILVEQSKLAKDERNFFEMLIFHADKEVRDLASETLSRVCKRLFELRDLQDNQDDQDKVQNIIDRIFNGVLFMMPNECVKAWWKLSSFGDFFYNIVLQGPKQVIYLCQQKLITRLVDLITRYTGQQVLYNNTKPPFESMIKTISLIVRCQASIVIKDEQINYLHDDQDMPSLQDLMLVKGISPYFEPFIVSRDELEMGKAFMLDYDDISSLLMLDKKTKQFYDIILRYNLETEEMAKLIGHICYRNLALSKKLGKVLLMGLNKVNADELPGYLGCLDTYFVMEDDYTNNRIEWIMGIPDLIVHKPSYGASQNPADSKLGATKIKDIQDSVYFYCTCLYKEISNMKECVLQMMYIYRKEKFQKAALFMMRKILQIINENINGSLHKYLLLMEPPAYTSMRYWDWIEPYLIEHIQYCTRNLYSQNKEELELCLIIQGIVEQIKQKTKDAQDKIEEQKIEEGAEDQEAKQVIQYMDNDGGPEPYIIWDPISQTNIKTIHIKENRVDVVLAQMIANVSKSTPNGYSNEALDQKLADQQQRSNQGGWMSQSGRKNKASRNRKKTYGRGKARNQRQYREKRSNNDSRSTHKDRTEEQIISDRQEDHPVVPEVFKANDQDGEPFNEGTKTPPNQEAEVSINKGDVEETIVPDDGDELSKRVEGGQDEGTVNNEVFYEEYIESGEPAASQNDAQYESYHRDQEEEIEEEQEEEATMQWQQELEVVLFMTLRNFHQGKTQVILIRFDQLKRDKVNFRMPYNELPFSVNAQHDRIALKFTKLKPYSSWGDLDCFEVIIPEEPQQQPQPDYYNVRSNFGANDGFITGDASDVMNVDQGANNTGNGAAAASATEEIECGACTFLNPKYSTRCEVCETPL